MDCSLGRRFMVQDEDAWRLGVRMVKAYIYHDGDLVLNNTITTLPKFAMQESLILLAWE